MTSFKERATGAAAAKFDSDQAINQKRQEVLTSAKERLMQDPRYAAIAGFLHGDELSEVVDYLVSEVWYQPHPPVTKRNVFIENSVQIHCIEYNGHTFKYINGRGSKFEFRDCDLKQEVKPQIPPTKTLVLPDQEIQYHQSQMFADKKRVNFVEIESEGDIDSEVLVARIIETALIKGGRVSFYGGERVEPGYRYKGKELTMLVSPRTLIEEQSARSIPIEFDCIARWNPFQSKLVYKVGNYSGDQRIQADSPDALFQLVAERIAQGQTLENAYNEGLRALFTPIDFS